MIPQNKVGSNSFKFSYGGRGGWFSGQTQLKVLIPGKEKKAKVKSNLIKFQNFRH